MDWGSVYLLVTPPAKPGMVGTSCDHRLERCCADLVVIRLCGVLCS